ncbi:MAG: hypothetical protein ACREHG_09060 [Candidatus Saccharimonadales bacterium]
MKFVKQTAEPKKPLAATLSQALKKVNRAIAFAFGVAKASALQKIKNNKVILSRLPSRVYGI